IALEQRTEPSPLARARVQRQLTPDEAAKRAGLTPAEVEWIEDGRLYRFGSREKATLARPLSAPPRGIARGEPRRLAGLPVVETSRSSRVKALAAIGA